MRQLFAIFVLACTFHCAGLAAAAQNDLVISHARIITGTGSVIENGAIVVKDGHIAAVIAGSAPANAVGTRIDGTGMTVIAGYVDSHRHLIQAGLPGLPTVDEFLKNRAPTAMRELLESGVTTVQSGGDDNVGILKLKQMVESGQIEGPRIITSARVPTAVIKSEAEVRAAVDAAHQAGAETIAEVWYPAIPWPYNPTEQETKNLAAGLDEAKKFGMLFQVHTVSPQAVLGAVKIGARYLVHSSHYAWMTDAEAQEVAATGTRIASSTSNPTPVFDVFNHDNKPTYRSGLPWPKGEPGLGEDRGRASGYMPVNGRTYFDNGIPFAYSSDTSYNATAGLAQELKTLNLVFSPIDMVKIIGQNAADFVNHGSEIGTLEVGKVGDILLLTGNPLDGYWNFLKPVMVIRHGVIMVDKRAQLRTVKTL